VVIRIPRQKTFVKSPVPAQGQCSERGRPASVSPAHPRRTGTHDKEQQWHLRPCRGALDCNRQLLSRKRCTRLSKPHQPPSPGRIPTHFTSGGGVVDLGLAQSKILPFRQCQRMTDPRLTVGSLRGGNTLQRHRMTLTAQPRLADSRKIVRGHIRMNKHQQNRPQHARAPPGQPSPPPSMRGSCSVGFHRVI